MRSKAIDENNVRIAAIAIALAKEYDAPWLEGNQSVTRDASGKFASGSGGGGSPSAQESSSGDSAQPSSAASETRQRSLGQRFSKPLGVVADAVEKSGSGVEGFFASTMTNFGKASSEIKNKLKPKAPDISAAVDKSVNEVLGSLYDEKADPKEFKKKSSKALKDLEKEYNAQLKKLFSTGMEDKEFCESVGRILGMQAWLGAAMLAGVGGEMGSDAMKANLKEMGISPKTRPDSKEAQEAMIAYTVRETEKVVQSGNITELLEQEQAQMDALKLYRRALKQTPDWLVEEDLAEYRQTIK